MSVNTEAHQLLKLPVLLHHYFDHKETNNTISILDFISKHYGEDNSKTSHNHNDEHEKLPFKSNDCGVVHASLVYCDHFSFNFTYHVPVFSKETIAYDDNFNGSSLLVNIWQPPKTV